MRVTMSVKSIRGLALALSVWLLVCGCATIKETATDLKTSFSQLFGGADENQTAEELATAGMDYYADGEYKKAIDHFQRLKDIYPFSKYAMLAELKLGDAHYRIEQYDDAIFAYEEFEKLHPRNEAIPYVIYQIGRCYFDRVTTPDRDQNTARKALETFQRLIKQYPRDPYARSAADHIVACYKSLSGHDFGIGVFYYKSKHYKAALNRFRSVVTEYPDVGYHQPALEYIVRTEKKLAEESVPDKEAPDAPARDEPGSG
jgi:outer membrane protein assembly factor BamD